MKVWTAVLLALLGAGSLCAQTNPPRTNSSSSNVARKDDVKLSSRVVLSDRWIFSMPDSVLLFSGEGPRLVEPGHSEMVLSRSTSHPSISRDGNLVAWGVQIPDESARVVPLEVSQESKECLETPLRPALAVYSVRERKTVTFPMGRAKVRYGDPEDSIADVAISPDGSRVAFTGCPSDCSEQSGIFLLEIETGRISPPLITDVRGQFDSQAMQFAGRRYVRHPSWSPDRTRLVLQLDQHVTMFGKESNTIQYQPDDSIAILDIASGELKIIAKGTNPSWSPTGEWIAYLDQTGESSMLIRPDGTEQKTLKKLGGLFRRVLAPWISFTDPPVWSPDGKKLLVNRYLGETIGLAPISDVVLLDVATRRMKRMRKNVLTIAGWASQQAK